MQIEPSILPVGVGCTSPYTLSLNSIQLRVLLVSNLLEAIVCQGFLPRCWRMTSKKLFHLSIEGIFSESLIARRSNCWRLHGSSQLTFSIKMLEFDRTARVIVSRLQSPAPHSLRGTSFGRNEDHQNKSGPGTMEESTWTDIKFAPSPSILYVHHRSS